MAATVSAEPAAQSWLREVMNNYQIPPVDPQKAMEFLGAAVRRDKKHFGPFGPFLFSHRSRFNQIRALFVLGIVGSAFAAMELIFYGNLWRYAAVAFCFFSAASLYFAHLRRKGLGVSFDPYDVCHCIDSLPPAAKIRIANIKGAARHLHRVVLFHIYTYERHGGGLLLAIMVKLYCQEPEEYCLGIWDGGVEIPLPQTAM